MAANCAPPNVPWQGPVGRSHLDADQDFDTFLTLFALFLICPPRFYLAGFGHVYLRHIAAEAGPPSCGPARGTQISVPSVEWTGRRRRCKSSSDHFLDPARQL